MFRIPSERSVVATFPLTFFVTDSGESIGRKLINARTTFESLNLIDLAFDPSYTNQSDNEVGTQIGYVTARMFLIRGGGQN